MKSYNDFQNGYQYFLHTVNEILDGTARRRCIEITEFKLGIHNPDSSIADVDMADNPTYKEWRYYDIVHKGELYRKALIRPGKTNITKALIEQDIKNTINQFSNINV